MKKIEILSPAGNMKCLKAAVIAGCDAVYLAGNLYGARSFADNFTNEEIIDAINYCHVRKVKVYVTVNTIIYEREVENFINYIRFLHINNVDAVIMQDLGMIDLVRKKFPNLEIHASTQMHINNDKDVLFLKNMGVKRVVMARETSYDVIKKVKKIKDIEVECFIHGALCLSYSGQCYMSTLIGSRSGNRGTCAQVCRKKYNLYDSNNNKLNEDNYLLSTKDLCTLNNIDKLIDIGIDSLKIEGRMKRYEYVYFITKMYRKYVDIYLKTGKLNIDNSDILEMKKLFNREFTKGFMFNTSNNDIINQKRPNHIGIKIGNTVCYKNKYLYIKLTDDLSINDGIRILDKKQDIGFTITKMYKNNKIINEAKKGDIISIYYDNKINNNLPVLLTTSNKQIKRINEEIKQNERKVNISLKVIAKLNNKLYLEAFDGENKVYISSDFIIEESKTKALSMDILKKQLFKTGNTVYKINNIDILMDNNIFINIKDINELRRKLLNLLDEKRLYKIPFIENDYKINVPEFNKVNKKTILINSKEEYDKYSNNYDIIYTENKDLLKLDKVIYTLPRVTYNYPFYNKHILARQIGSLLVYKDINTDFSFNVVNSYTVAFLHSIGVDIVTLSYELTNNQIKQIIINYKNRYNKSPNLEVIVDSNLEAMICKFDLNKMYNKNITYLEDELKNRYKVVSYNNYMKIYNYKRRNYERKEELYDIGVNYLRTEI